jgi:hypothetical protein
LLVPDEHGGLTPLSHYPPLYSATLAAVSKFTGDALPSGRWLDVVLFPLNVLLLAGLGRRIGLAAGATMVVCALFVLAPDIMLSYVSIRSETLVLTWWLLGLGLLLEWRRHGSEGLFWTAAVLAALAMLTRYVGVSLGLAGAWFILTDAPGQWGRKLARSAAYLFVAVAPTALWMFTHRGPQGVADRHPAFYGLTHYQYGKFFGAFARWALPLDGHYAAKGVFILLLGTLATALLVLRARAGARPFSLVAAGGLERSAMILLVANLAVYEAVVFLSGIFLDPVQDVSSRMQIPPFVFMLLLLGAGASALGRGERGRWTAASRVLGGAWLAFLLGGYLYGAAVWLGTADAEALGDNNADIRHSPTLATVNQRFANVPLYTNYAGRIYYHTGRSDYQMVPFPRDKTRNAAKQDFADELAGMVADLAARHGVIIYFKDVQPKMQTFEELEATPGLRVVEDYPDAVILGPAKIN